MAASNPAIGNTALTNRPANDGPLSAILCRDLSSVDEALSNVAANGPVLIADAIAKGHSWEAISDYFGCTVAHLRSRWLSKLNSDEKALIKWAERQYAAKLIPHLMNRMQETVDKEYKMPTDADPIEFNTKVAALKDKQVQTLERMAKTAQAHVNASSDDAKPEADQRPPPAVNIIINADTAESMLKFAN